VVLNEVAEMPDVDKQIYTGGVRFILHDIVPIPKNCQRLFNSFQEKVFQILNGNVYLCCLILTKLCLTKLKHPDMQCFLPNFYQLTIIFVSLIPTLT